jgi:hypothetical protein
VINKKMYITKVEYNVRYYYQSPAIPYYDTISLNMPLENTKNIVKEIVFNHEHASPCVDVYLQNGSVQTIFNINKIYYQRC